MAVHKLFESEKKQDTESGISYQVSFYSTDFDELQTYIQDHYRHNSITDKYGLIRKVEFRCQGGIHYCDVEGWHDKAPTGILYVKHTEDGPERHEITSVCIPLPLERLNGYRVCWNHYLWVTVPEDYDGGSPTGWPSGSTEMTKPVSFVIEGVRYAWTDGIYPPTIDPGEGNKWIVYSNFPTKPGVTHVDYYTYQITEEGDHSTDESAFWVMRKALNTPVARPILGTMGVSGGSWKCDNASVSPNGKRWRARLVWTWSPGGWDSDLYPVILKTT